MPVDKGRDKKDSGNCIMRNFSTLHSLPNYVDCNLLYGAYLTKYYDEYNLTSAVGFAIDFYI
jgi:hypothetical protein